MATSNDTMEVNCPAGQEYCKINTLLLYPQLEYNDYVLEIDLQVESSIASLVDGILFGAKLENPQFTNSLLAFRYFWFGFSLISLLVYSVFYAHSRKNELTFEHHFILVLSISLVFFNDPIFAVTVFYPSKVSAVFSTIFVMQFVALLTVFWVIMWRRMHFEGAKRTSNMCGWMSILIGLIMFIVLTVGGSVASVYSRFEPGVQANTELHN